MGSFLVNSSATNEFHFFRDLRQCDHLPPFLFILVLERLHMVFLRVVDHGLFSDISFESEFDFCIFHLFFADVVVFMGEWKDSNVHSICSSS